MVSEGDVREEGEVGVEEGEVKEEEGGGGEEEEGEGELGAEEENLTRNDVTNKT